MKFEEILPHLRNGEYVWRSSWYQPWSKLQQHFWYEKINNNTVLQSLFSARLLGEDFEASDWEVYTRKTKNDSN